MDQVPTVQIAFLDTPDGTELPLLDVREPDEWDAGHAPHAVSLPLSQLVARVGEVPQRAAVVCRVGGRSAQAVVWLRAQGYDVVNVDGGMLAWQRAGRPLVDTAGRPGTVA
jgi:rhodanese-related sulfurtransferase